MIRPSISSRLSDVLDWWIELRCDCGRSLMVPCRVLAADMKQDRTLREVTAKLRCVVCVERPRRMRLLSKHPSGEDGQTLEAGTESVPLVGRHLFLTTPEDALH